MAGLGFLKSWGIPKSPCLFQHSNSLMSWRVWGYPYFRKPPFQIEGCANSQTLVTDDCDYPLWIWHGGGVKDSMWSSGFSSPEDVTWIENSGGFHPSFVGWTSWKHQISTDVKACPGNLRSDFWAIEATVFPCHDIIHFLIDRLLRFVNNNPR